MVFVDVMCCVLNMVMLGVVVGDIGGNVIVMDFMV